MRTEKNERESKTVEENAQVLPPPEDSRGDRAEPHPPEPLVVVGDVGRGDGALPLGDPLGPEAGRRYLLVDTFPPGISQVSPIWSSRFDTPKS